MSMFNESVLRSNKGGYKTQSLFVETQNLTCMPIMSLSEYDKVYKGKKLPSLWQIYIEESDPTEYKVAMRVFGSWRLWSKITNNKACMAYIQQYRDQLEQKILSESVEALRKTSLEEGSRGTAAAKFLAEKGWEKAPRRKAGAPSKAERAGALKTATREDQDTIDQMKRLGLKIV